MRLIKIHFAGSSLDFINEEHDYDEEKNHDMVLEAAESILGYFGF
jgi:hypothetical protein